MKCLQRGLFSQPVTGVVSESCVGAVLCWKLIVPRSPRDLCCQGLNRKISCGWQGSIFFLADECFFHGEILFALGDWCKVLTSLGPFPCFSPLRGTTVLCIILVSVTVNIYSLHFRHLLSSGDLQRFKFQAGISTAKKPPSGTGLPNCQELCGWWMRERRIEGPVGLKYPPHPTPRSQVTALVTLLLRDNVNWLRCQIFPFFPLAYMSTVTFSHLYTEIRYYCATEPAS